LQVHHNPEQNIKIKGYMQNIMRVTILDNTFYNVSPVCKAKLSLAQCKKLAAHVLENIKNNLKLLVLTVPSAELQHPEHTQQ
jgi:hypothetical protein